MCPSHCNIQGNERADTLAKLGASSKTCCQFACTTKTWLLTQARAELTKRWKDELPLSSPSFKFPEHLQGVGWAKTRAIWRVFCNRSPTDVPPNITADPCPCGQDLNTSHHLLRNCHLLAGPREALLHFTTSDIHTLSFTAPQNTLPIHRFLRATGLGHSSRLLFCDNHHTTNSADGTDSDSSEPDFRAFEPYRYRDYYDRMGKS